MTISFSPASECFANVLSSSREAAGRRGVPEKSFHDLDWDVLSSAIRDATNGEDAYELAGSLGILDAEHFERRRGEILELQQLIGSGGRLPIGQPPALGTPLLRARKIDALDAEDLLLIATSLDIAGRIARFFDNRSEAAPLLVAHAVRLDPRTELAHDIRQTFDASGKIKDEASRELGKLRRQARRLRETIQDRLTAYLQAPKFEGILQDDFVTLRDERFVLPVKAGERGDMPGIVHGHSSSGATLYIEPEDLISLNNDLQVARNDVRREEHRILALLTSRVRVDADAIEANGDIITYIDLTNACAAVSLTYRGEAIGTHTGEMSEFHLREARHPLLALRDEAGELKAVGNDIRFGGASRCLIISGPNTGGKTVTLKTVGLFALMTRAGLPVPCHADSVMPLFKRVFTDVGDEQTVQGDLSTFSAHVSNIASFVDRIVPGTLVLLDELFAGTDPAQATTLGRALLLEVDRLSGWSVVTTHLEGLKSLAFEDERFACASMGFDIEKLAPTYRLRAGLPGSSYAHRIAARLGLPARIVEHAEALADSHQEVETEQLLRQLEDAHDTIFREKDRIEVLRREVEAERGRLRTEIEKARRHEDSILSEETRNLRAKIRELRDILSGQERRLATLNEKPNQELSSTDREALREARRIAEEVQQRTSREIERQRSVDDGDLSDDDIDSLTKGSRVYVTTYKQPGVVAESPQRGEKVVVQMGPVRVNVPITTLRLDTDDAGLERRRDIKIDRSSTAEPAQRVDLRGMRVDEALEQVEARVEELALLGGFSLTLIHGHGTGALKRAIRAQLPQMSYEIRFRAGARSEGGDGVTVVELEQG